MILLAGTNALYVRSHATVREQMLSIQKRGDICDLQQSSTGTATINRARVLKYAMQSPSTISPLRFIFEFILLIMGALITFSASAHELKNAYSEENGNHKTEVTVAIAHGNPPFYTLNGDGGIEWQLIKSTLDAIGHHTSRPLYIPRRRAMELYERGVVDAIWLANPDQEREGEGWHLSDPLLPRDYVAITLAHEGLVITSPDSLDRMDVGIEPGAEKVLGDTLLLSQGYDAAFQLCKSDTLMLLMLYENRLDAIISEESTFEFYRKHLPLSVHKEQAVTYHKIFPTIYPRLVFYDDVLRDEFNEELKKAKLNLQPGKGGTESLMKSAPSTKQKESMERSQ